MEENFEILPDGKTKCFTIRTPDGALLEFYEKLRQNRVRWL